MGKRPKDPANLVQKAELVLTLNIFYPTILKKVGDLFFND